MAKKKALKKALRKMLKKQAAAGYGAPSGPAAGPAAAPGLLQGLGLPAGLGLSRKQQFLVGALIGAAATWVMSDEQLRAKLLKSVMGLYGNVAGGIEELKEQLADLKAEAEAERMGGQ